MAVARKTRVQENPIDKVELLPVHLEDGKLKVGDYKLKAENDRLIIENDKTAFSPSEDELKKIREALDKRSKDLEKQLDSPSKTQEGRLIGATLDILTHYTEEHPGVSIKPELVLIDVSKYSLSLPKTVRSEKTINIASR